MTHLNKRENPCSLHVSIFRNRVSPRVRLSYFERPQVAALPEFQAAKWVKVNPDRPQAEAPAEKPHLFSLEFLQVDVYLKT